MQFKQDDTAICDLNDQVVEIQFGPVTSSGNRECYLVKFATGASSLVWEEDLKPVPRFKVGQKVSSKFVKNSLTVTAGPFVYQMGDFFYVLEKAEGSHTTELERDLSPL